MYHPPLSRFLRVSIVLENNDFFFAALLSIFICIHTIYTIIIIVMYKVICLVCILWINAIHSTVFTSVYVCVYVCL